jgi:hypothetical protein
MFRSWARNRFLKGRVPLANDEFLARLDANETNERYLVSIRDVMARACRVQPEMIHPEDSPFALTRIMSFDLAGGWDGTIFEMFLEEELDMEFREHLRLPSLVGSRFLFWGERAPENFGAWALKVSGVLHELESQTRPV